MHTYIFMKKIHLFLLTLLAVTGLAAPAFTAPVSAAFADDVKCTGSNCVADTPDEAANGQCTKNNCDLVKTYLNPFIKLLGIGVGLAATIGIAIGGVEYASSGGDPQKTARGKGHIIASIVALVAFFFLYAALKFLTPGNI